MHILKKIPLTTLSISLFCFVSYANASLCFETQNNKEENSTGNKVPSVYLSVIKETDHQEQVLKVKLTLPKADEDQTHQKLILSSSLEGKDHQTDNLAIFLDSRKSLCKWHVIYNGQESIVSADNHGGLYIHNLHPKGSYTFRTAGSIHFLKKAVQAKNLHIDGLIHTIDRLHVNNLALSKKASIPFLPSSDFGLKVPSSKLGRGYLHHTTYFEVVSPFSDLAHTTPTESRMNFNDPTFTQVRSELTKSSFSCFMNHQVSPRIFCGNDMMVILRVYLENQNIFPNLIALKRENLTDINTSSDQYHNTQGGESKSNP